MCSMPAQQQAPAKHIAHQCAKIYFPLNLVSVDFLPVQTNAVGKDSIPAHSSSIGVT